jgi:hypothetical protein
MQPTRPVFRRPTEARLEVRRRVAPPCVMSIPSGISEEVLSSGFELGGDRAGSAVTGKPRKGRQKPVA